MLTYVRAFEEGDATQRYLLGGKGANLAEMTRMGLPVPPGFIVTTDACKAYLAEGQAPAGLWDEVAAAVARLEERTGRALGSTDRPLLVSVRSGAPFSMPGMMDTILNLGLNDATVAALAAETGDESFALDAHRRFIEMYGEIVMGADRHELEDAREQLLDRAGVDDVRQLPLPLLRELVATQKRRVAELTGEEVPTDPMTQLRGAVEAVFRSWNTPRAITYRRLEGIPEDLGTAVNVQVMAFGNVGDDSATGVAFTRNPSTGEPTPYGDWLPDAQGEDVVAGVRVTRDLPSLGQDFPEAYEQLIDICRTLEQHFADMCDIEFTIERGTLYILQVRTGKRSAQAAVRIAVDLHEEGLIDRDTAIRRVTPQQLDKLLHPQFDASATFETLTTGLPASPGAATGHVAFTADDAVARAADGTPVILVRPETSPDDLHGMAASKGILTSRGGLVSHAAIVARMLGLPAVCGAEKVAIDLDARVLTVGDVTIKEGEVISLDGTTGQVVVGEVPVVVPKPDPTVETLLRWADEVRTLGVRANADLPKEARHALANGAEGIGLCRTEHMFMGDRLPLIRHVILARDDADREAALAELGKRQKEDFVELLEVMDGKPVTVRLLDPPLHEFLPDHDELVAAEARGELDEEGRRLKRAVEEWAEENPMLGTRGVRLDVVVPGLYPMQVRALEEAALERLRAGGDPRVEIMIPLTVSGREMARIAKEVREVVEAARGETDLHIPIGTMIETPRAALVAGEIAEHAEFFSFGTNDLTQMTYGFSRDDVEARIIGPYLEAGIVDVDPFASLDTKGVGELVRIAVERGRATRPDLHLGICGEQGGDPATIAFCQEVGLDYVSCSPYRVPIARLAAAHAALAAREA